MIFKSANANIYRVGDLLQYFKLDCKCETRHSIKLLAGLPFVLAFLSMKYKQSLGTTKLSSEFDTTVNLTHLLRKINNLARGRISDTLWTVEPIVLEISLRKMPSQLSSLASRDSV